MNIIRHIRTKVCWYKDAVEKVVPKVYWEDKGLGDIVYKIWTGDTFNRGTSLWGASDEERYDYFVELLRKNLSSSILNQQLTVGGKLL